ncbi:hypothetical protein COV11_00450 [Candidatus Woesearchaeota archaeon CG10_big_fil_rev_8_21_14_0_10_30_7]|nr:MAG: hypothetical protein COV11_00450 [Candidatus Woesearchaeota archaeon CG10_big_fil_rev_8_21_14_0_10_30_7]
MKTKTSSIVLMIICTLFTSVAQLFLKKGANNLSLLSVLKFFESAITNPTLIIGCILYFIAATIFVIALKGGELSVLYPIIATSYFWVTLLALFFLNEQINYFKWMGIFIIFIGITFVGVGSKNAN